MKFKKQDLRMPSIFIQILHGAQDEWSLNQFLSTLLFQKKSVLKLYYKEKLFSLPFGLAQLDFCMWLGMGPKR